jgi:hypothetical protein
MRQVTGCDRPFQVSADGQAFLDAKVDVVIDFTHLEAARTNLLWLAEHGINAVTGTTGFSDADLQSFRDQFTKSNCVIAPNFAIGAVLMMRFAELAAPFFETAEIVELHHDAKIDAPSGTAMLFAQTAAPTGWTKSTTHNNKALRVVSGAASSGGSVDFTTAFSSQSVTGTIGGTVLTTSQIPAHRHYGFLNVGDTTNSTVTGEARAIVGYTSGNPASGYIIRGNDPTSEPSVAPSSATGSGASHDHTFTGTAINLAVAYVDVIIATKD